MFSPRKLAEALYTINKGAKLYRDIFFNINCGVWDKDPTPNAQLRSCNLLKGYVVTDAGRIGLFGPDGTFCTDEWDYKACCSRLTEDLGRNEAFSVSGRGVDNNFLDAAYRSGSIIPSQAEQIAACRKLHRLDHIAETAKDYKDRLYRLKAAALDRLIEDLNLVPIKWHQFGDGRWRPLYEVADLTFHGDGTWELPTDAVNAGALPLICGENQLSSSLTLSEAEDLLCDYIKSSVEARA
jgi:hypothetical protein